MTNENFKDVYIDRDDYLFLNKINNNNIGLFRVILVILLIVFLYTTYVVVNKVFLIDKEMREPKLLFVVYILIFAIMYFIYHEIAIVITNTIVNNIYPI